MKNLVISNNDNLWSEEFINILVGDWCFLGYEDKCSHNKFKYEIFDSHWSNLNKLNDDIKYLQSKVWDEVIDFISLELNKYHGVSLPKKYWENVLMGWLVIFIPMAFDRYETLNLIKKRSNNSNLKTKIFEFDDTKFISNETFEFSTDVSLTNDWTHWINSKIVKYLEIDFELLSKLEVNNNLQSSTPENNIIKINTKKRTNALKNNKKFYKKIFTEIGLYKIFKRKLAIIDCHLPKLDKIILYLMSGQIPESYNSSFYEYSGDKDIDFRKNNCNFNSEEKNFLNFLKQNLFLNIPKSFLEDYKGLIKHQKNLNWPKKPNIILSSIGGHYNDIFNIYSAEKRLLGAKLIFAQHGGVYGVSKFSFGEFIENKADRFITWGWKREEKNFPLFFLGKDLKKKVKKNHKANGIIMSVTNFFNIPYQPRAAPNDSKETKKHLENINNFLAHLDKKLLSNFDINHADFNRKPNLRDEIQFKEVRIQNLKEPVITRSANYKLVVETINSTGFIENLYYNVPFIALFDKKYCPLNDEAKKYYKNLETSKIIFYSPIDAAKHVNKIYNNIDNWWSSAELQNGRKIFCEKYVKNPNNFFKNWKKAFEF